jgi:glyoxylase-like metal-dependent hydrolase (beta-lactamase superfamily II)/8-oxo-dGTP pyrophosphatase MutT (NUDIX family)
MADPDPRANTPLEGRMPPRPAATVVLMRDAQGAPEILMLRRSSRASYFSGAFVFPGGMLDPEDLAPEVVSRIAGMGPRDADARLGLESGGLGYWVAVARETYEESGILLAHEESGEPVSPERVASLAHWRDALNRKEASFGELLHRERLLVPAASMAYFAHWITPPVQKRRFDTRFFIAASPAGQEGAHDDGEMVETLWLPATEFLERAERKEIEIALPTLQVLRAMRAHATPESAVTHARSLNVIVTNRPCFAEGRDGRRLFRSGDPQYAEIHWTDPEETGNTSYDIIADSPKRLDSHVTRITAGNPGVMTGPGTNTYLVGEREIAVIDPGPADPAHVQAIIDAAQGRPIRWILCTHTHRDHSPAAQLLKATTGAQVLGRAAPDALNHDASFAPDLTLSDGDEVDIGGAKLIAIHTPGHASNHLCFLLDRTGMLFTGDHVMQGSTVVIWPPDGSMRDYLASLRKLLAREIAILAPAHGYLIGRPAHEIERLVEHRLARERKVRAALGRAGGAATLEAILPDVYDDVPPAIHPVAARSLLAHLEKLMADGEIHLQDSLYRLRA